MKVLARTNLVRWAVTLWVGAFCMGTNCLNPCQQLATKICSCEANETDKQACNRQVQIQQDQRQLSNPERQFCFDRFQACECRDLKAGNLEQCGLARE